MIQIRVKCGIKIFWDFSGALTNFSGSELSVITFLSTFSRTQGQVALRITFLFDFIIIYAHKKRNILQQAGDRRRKIVNSVSRRVDRSNGTDPDYCTCSKAHCS